MKNFFIIILLSFNFLYGQSIQWADASSGYNLPVGVKLFKGERSSPALKCWYLDVDLNNSKIAIRPYILQNEKMGVPGFVNRVGAFAGINAGYFDPNSTTVLSTAVYPDEVLAQNPQFLNRNNLLYPVTRACFGIKTDKSLSVNWIWHFSGLVKDIYTFANPTNNIPGTPATAPAKINGKALDSLHYAFGGGPVLIKNGAGRITYNEEVFWGSGVELDLAQPRTAIGYTNNNHVILFVADGRQTASSGLTLTELKNILLNLGCYEAMNLDGGGSSQMAVGNQLVNLPEGGTYTRLVPVIVAVVNSDSANFPKPVLFDKVIDNGDPECQFIGSWIASSNSGYYGSTPAMLATIGSGEKQAIFSFTLPKTANYLVGGWWVNSFNRSNATPFIIKHKNGSDTIKTDQTANGSKWNNLGSFRFDSNKTYSVTITNNTTNGQYVCADAVRIISYDTVFVPSFVNYETGKIISWDLSQNYPNPFNPNTTIKYFLPKDDFISLNLYDLLGRNIETLSRGRQSAGSHTINFNGSHLSAGVYFYELRSKDFRQIKKMLLLN